MIVNKVIFLCICFMGCLGFVAMPRVIFLDNAIRGLCLFLAFEGIALFILENVKDIYGRE